MKLSENGISLIKSFEGLELEAYKCPSNKWTIGFGHTGKVNGKPIKQGMKITAKQADELFLIDKLKFEKIVSKYDSKYKWTQNQFDALTCFAFNIGSITQLTALGTRSKLTIASKIPLYNKSSGIALQGLTRRREIERILFLK